METQRQPIVIRRAGIEDVATIHASILELARHLGSETYVESSEDDLRLYGFADNPAFQADIAEIDGAFAGVCLHFPMFSTWMGRPGVYVQDLYVSPLFRGRKVGETLLRHVARLSRAAGGVYLRLSVDVDNVNAQAFYEKLGIGRADYEQIHKITGEAFAAFCDTGDDKR